MAQFKALSIAIIRRHLLKTKVHNKMSTVHTRTWTKKQNRREERPTDVMEKMCFKVRFERCHGGCLTERQRELVPGRQTRVILVERMRVESLGRGILRLKVSDVEGRVRDGE